MFDIDQARQQIAELKLHLRPQNTRENSRRHEVMNNLLIQCINAKDTVNFVELVTQCLAAGIDIRKMQVSTEFGADNTFNNLLAYAYHNDALGCVAILYRIGMSPLTETVLTNLLYKTAEVQKYDEQAALNFSSMPKKPMLYQVLDNGEKIPNYPERIKLALQFQTLPETVEKVIIDLVTGFYLMQGNAAKSITIGYSQKLSAIFHHQNLSSVPSTSSGADAKASASATRPNDIIAIHLMQITANLCRYGSILSSKVGTPSRALTHFAFFFAHGEDDIPGTDPKLAAEQIIEFKPLDFIKEHAKKAAAAAFIAEFKAYASGDANTVLSYLKIRKFRDIELQFSQACCDYIRRYAYNIKGNDESQLQTLYNLRVLQATAILNAAADLHSMLEQRNQIDAIAVQSLFDRVRLFKTPYGASATPTALIDILNLDPVKSTSDTEIKSVDSATVAAKTELAKVFVKVITPEKPPSKSLFAGLFTLPVCRIPVTACGPKPVGPQSDDTNNRYQPDQF